MRSPGLVVRNAALQTIKAALRVSGKFFEASSLVGAKHFYEVEAFPWIKDVEAEWPLIRKELDQLLERREDLANFQDLSVDQEGLTVDDGWKTFFFYAYGHPAGRSAEICPETERLLGKIPGMKTAFFSIFGPGKHIPPHRGPYNGVLRYQLALRIPEPRKNCGIKVKDETRHWEEGKSLVFDDTYIHEAWNHTDEDRVVLFVDFMRPMRFPASSINAVFIKMIGLSPFVMGNKGKYDAWQERFDQIANN